MKYKLKLLDINEKEIGIYKGNKVVTEEILENCFIIRMPFDFSDNDLRNDPNAPFVRNMSDFIKKLMDSGKLQNKTIFVVPKTVQFMELEEYDR